MNRQQVLVEIVLAAGLSPTEALARAQQQIVLEGFHLDTNYGAIPMQPSEGANAEEPTAEGQLYIIRGTLAEEQVDALKAIEGVINVFDDGRIEHFDQR